MGYQETSRKATTSVSYAKSRVLLLDEQNHILLFLTRHDVPGYPARWLTTGGHLEAGESHRDAAIRELFEETGLTIDEPGNVVWAHDFVAERSPGVFANHHEEFFVHRTMRFAPSHAAWTPEEHVDIVDERWWSLATLQAATDPVEPANLIDLLTRLGVS
jgi:8-oxo-dGTP pyrophosphatase MutT (NUDIX family)